jgi:excinuclease ABC subunit B
MEGSKNFTKKQFIAEMDKQLEEEYLTPKELAHQIDSLEELMLEYAKKLEFEEAANIRNKITELKNKLFAA